MQYTYYKIIQSPSKETLEFEVNSALEKGWQPLNGPAIIVTKYSNGYLEQNANRLLFYQAMVK